MYGRDWFRSTTFVKPREMPITVRYITRVSQYGPYIMQMKNHGQFGKTAAIPMSPVFDDNDTTCLHELIEKFSLGSKQESYGVPL